MNNGKPAAIGAAAGFLLVYGPMLRAWARALADPELRDWLGVPSVTQITKTMWSKGWHQAGRRSRLVSPTTKKEQGSWASMTAPPR